MSTRRASVIWKLPYRRRRYSSASSSDAAATQCASRVESSSALIPAGPLKVHSCASHAPGEPGRNRGFVAASFLCLFTCTTRFFGRVNVPRVPGGSPGNL